jgi:5-methylcytosine-specific restriction endonuclease McrA
VDRKTLVLNASFEPLCAVTPIRAVTLVAGARAEILAPGAGVIRSVSTVLPRPAVVRLLRYVRVPYRERVPLTRRALMARDDRTCQYCGRPGATVDHVLPRSRGGQHVWENVVVACGSCNHTKADRLLSELGWTLARVPGVPRGAGWLAFGPAEPAWFPYLPAGA